MENELGVSVWVGWVDPLAAREEPISSVSAWIEDCNVIAVLKCRFMAGVSDLETCRRRTRTDLRPHLSSMTLLNSALVILRTECRLVGVV